MSGEAGSIRTNDERAGAGANEKLAPGQWYSREKYFLMASLCPVQSYNIGHAKNSTKYLGKHHLFIWYPLSYRFNMQQFKVTM